MAGSAGGIRAGRAYVELFADKSPLVRGLKDAAEVVGNFGSKIRNVGLGAIGGATAAAAPLALSLHSFASAGSELADMSARTGASVESLGKLGYAAAQTGTDMAAVEKSVKKLQDNLGSAMTGNKAAAESFTSLGLDVKKLASLPVDQQMALIADKLDGIQNPALKTASAINLFGKSATDLLPMFVGGAAGLNELTSRAEQLGLVMSTKDADAADMLGDRFDDLTILGKRTSQVIGAALAPAATDLADKLIDVVVATNGWIQENPEFVTGIASGAAALATGGAALATFGTTVTIVGASLSGLATAGSFVTAAVTGLVSPAILVTAGITGLTAAAIWAAGGFERLAETGSQSWKAIQDAIAGGDLALAGNIAIAGLNVVWQAGLAKLETAWFNTIATIKGTSSVITFGALGGSADAIETQRQSRENSATKGLRDAEKELADLQAKAAEAKNNRDAGQESAKKNKGKGTDLPAAGGKLPKISGSTQTDGTYSGLAASRSRGVEQPIERLTDSIDGLNETIKREADKPAEAPPGAGMEAPAQHEPDRPMNRKERRAAAAQKRADEEQKRLDKVNEIREKKGLEPLDRLGGNPADRGSGRTEDFSGTDGKEGFGSGQYTPIGGRKLPTDDVRGRGQYLTDANRSLNDQLGGFGLGERLNALREIRSGQGWMPDAPLSKVADSYPKEFIDKKIQEIRDRNLLQGTMPNLALSHQVGIENPQKELSQRAKMLMSGQTDRTPPPPSDRMLDAMQKAGIALPTGLLNQINGLQVPSASDFTSPVSGVGGNGEAGGFDVSLMGELKSVLERLDSHLLTASNYT